MRDAFLESLRRRLVGPSGAENEELSGMRPTENYIAGVLGPQNGSIAAEENDSLGNGGDSEDGVVETAVSAALSNSFKPAAIGFTCIVDQKAARLVGSVKAARYAQVKSKGSGETSSDAPDLTTDTAYPVDPGAPTLEHAPTGEKPAFAGLLFRRQAVNSGDFEVDVSVPRGARKFPEGRYRVEWRTRPAKGSPDARILTITVINEDRVKDEARAIDVAKHLFQAELSLRGRDVSPFLPRYLATAPDSGATADQMDLLYRNEPAFATGHGCAAVWAPPASGRVSWIRTEALPSFELPLVQSPDLEGDVLSIGWLGTESQENVLSGLSGLCRMYADWIDTQELEANSLEPGSLRRVALRNIAACRETARRMQEGTETLKSNAAAWDSFQMMNQVIDAQLSRSLASRGTRKKPRWRSFQLAFILSCIPGVCRGTPIEDPVHLLWFPTGGGKTEAYLGLSAFAICFRRLSSGRRIGGGGVTVLMRYTLRLLTVQQFQRAAATICELEARRRRDWRRLGDEEVSIGLWVGKASTPNWLDIARKQLESPGASESSPVQLSSCPYCLAKLDPRRDYRFSGERKSIEIRCPNHDCPFGDHLPVYVVDEELYRRCPTLVVGTVDKFARLPWVEQTRALFGLVGAWCPVHGYSLTNRCETGNGNCTVSAISGVPPPSIIIQDELHLISGPLGTMVGVYEGLIDFLCRRSGRIPVVIGSSATVRNAVDQCRSLYGRAVAVFPPRCLSPTNTFFSEEIPLATRPGRLYVGVLPSGFTVKTTLIRTYASLLVDREQLLPSIAMGTTEGDALRDPYWTIVGYFNSLRELGGAQRLVEDDVPAQMRVFTGQTEKYPPIEKEELTSRLKGSEIPGVLERIQSELGGTPEPPDMLLATNMISVGVDVGRLSVMVVTGQPKATAEYIQSTSRVGREHPGLVVTVYNWARPRDRSHMEDFLDYHSTLYRHVEANSVTPYTDPALRRGLHAVLVAAVRMLEDGMGANDSAGGFRKTAKTVGDLRDFMASRLGDPRDPTDPARLVLERFDSVVDRWAELVRTRGGRLKYSGEEDSLLVPMEEGSDRLPEGIPTLNSLREVEPSTGLRFEAD